MWKLISGLLALPVLLVLAVLMLFRGSEDYTRVVNLNWELDLPASQGCLYETDSGASFRGDGERYHILEYAGDGRLEQALAEQATPLPSAENPVTEILDDLSVPADQRPDFADCGGPEDLYIDVAYTGSLEDAREWIEEVEASFPGFPIHADPLSLSVACHIGPGALAVTLTKVLKP